MSDKTTPVKVKRPGPMSRLLIWLGLKQEGDRVKGESSPESGDLVKAQIAKNKVLMDRYSTQIGQLERQISEYQKKAVAAKNSNNITAARNYAAQVKRLKGQHNKLQPPIGQPSQAARAWSSVNSYPHSPQIIR